MDWIEVTFTADNESAESLVEILQRYGHQGVSIEQAGFEMATWEDEIPTPDVLYVRAYFPADAQAPAKEAQIREAVRYLNMLRPLAEPSFKTVYETDWAEAWKVHYKPLRLGQRLYIRPSWIEVEDTQPDDVLIALDPGMAFGTGTHPSTQLCLIALENILAARPHLDVLDLGCGSGILSIAAAKLGAGKILALDVEEVAVLATQENAARNGVQHLIRAQNGSLESLLGAAQRFDLALVNILAKVIINMCEAGLGRVLRPRGIGVFGGIIHDQAEAVEAALRGTGLEPTRRYPMGEWVVIEARKG